MRRIAIINQKGGVGKTTTTANLGAALAEQGRRVVLVDMDAQANLSLSLGVEAADGSPTSYSVLVGEATFAAAVRPTAVPNLSLVASHIDLSGAEMELASQIGREFLLRDALTQWADDERARTGRAPADYVLFDCPPSLGLLSINALASAGEVLITLQTEFLALQGMSKLVGVVQLLRKRLNPELVVTGILPCLYESRLRLAREVLGEIRKYFPGQVLPVPIRANVKLAEAPSFGQTIFQYAPDSIGAMDYRCAAREVLRMEARDAELAGLPPFRESVLAGTNYAERATDRAVRPAVSAATPHLSAAPASATRAPATPPRASAPVASANAASVPVAAAPVASVPAASARAVETTTTTAPTAAAAASTAKPATHEKRARRAPPVAARAITPPAEKPAAARGTPARATAPPAPKSAAPARDAAVTPKKTAPTPRAKSTKSSAVPQSPAPSAELPQAAKPLPPEAPRAKTIAEPSPAAPTPKSRAPKAAHAHSKTANTPSALSTPHATAPTNPAPTPAAPSNVAPAHARPAPAPSTPSRAPKPAAVQPLSKTPTTKPARRAAAKVKRDDATVLTPLTPPAAKRDTSNTPPTTSHTPPATTRSAAPGRDEERVVRADDLPPLPPDAFEILASFGLDP